MKSYRPNVAAILMRSDGYILICERLNVTDAWQFPQGGIDKGETPEQALTREVQEEIGLSSEEYELTDKQGPYRYDYPADVLLKKQTRHPNYIGQEQTYFLCKVHRDNVKIDLDQDHPEFSRYQWINPMEFKLDWVPPFKREVYARVFLDFFHLNLVS